MKDPRMSKLASNLVNYSLKVQKGEKVLIESYETDSEFVCELVNAVAVAGGLAFVETFDRRVQRAILLSATEEQVKLMAKYALVRMQDADCYIGVRGGRNSFELSDVPSAQNEMYAKLYGHPVHQEERVCRTRWVVLRYPGDSMSQLSGMSTEAFEDYYYSVCNLDYSKMDRAMDGLKALMDKTDRVRLVAGGTDLSFSIKGIGGVKCSGGCNIPDGEVYSAPVKDSVNGVITYNAPSIERGLKFENVCLAFKDGKIIKATANYTDKLNEILDTDEGARYVGEFAIGVNPYITKPMGDILFDEKIAGSIHFTPGASYDTADNSIRSAVHWDLVLIMTPDYGGGEIWFDDVLIRKDGLFVVDELLSLNPENLK
ncbi:MAG: aminopeptidase [Firmicutes bacterium]|nr:aminopeptidase [Bacillota bacterium]